MTRPRPSYAESMAALGQAVDDLREVLRAAFVPALQRVSGALARFAAMWSRLDERDQLRIQYGPRQLTDDGRWQSNMCAAWLHDDCPNPAATDCQCTCHGGTLR